jgi:hypothetical protein
VGWWAGDGFDVTLCQEHFTANHLAVQIRTHGVGGVKNTFLYKDLLAALRGRLGDDAVITDSK